MNERKDRKGEVNYNNQGLKMWVKEYKNNRHIDIEFEDGYIAYNKTYDNFIKKSINNPNFKYSMFKDRTGEINYNKYNSKMTIIEYNLADDILVEFENGYKTNSTYNEFKKGIISNPYDKTVCGVGFIGEGSYKASINGEQAIQYLYWRAMLQRCYDEKSWEKHPTYKKCSVCEEWLNFQNFAQWHDENYYKIENEIMCLDKDILHKGNKEYSPETCVFVPERINVLFTKNDAKRGEYPIGVYLQKSTNRFVSQLSILSKDGKIQKRLGFFDTPVQGFNVYKIEKEKYIKQVADEYKDKIPKKLYDAMYRYEVEITD